MTECVSTQVFAISELSEFKSLSQNVTTPPPPPPLRYGSLWHYNPGAQWLLIIISRTEGLMCGINRRYMGDYGMAGPKLPKLCVWPVLTTKVKKKDF